MKCADCQDVLAEYALDSLGPREAEQIAEHLAGGCADCQQQLDGVRAAWAALADTLPPVAPPPQLKADLLARLSAEPVPSSDRPRHALRPEQEPVTLSRDGQNIESAWRWQSTLPYIAATICGIALGFWFARGSAIDSELTDRYHAQLLQAERTFGAPQMRFAALHMTENRPDVHGYLIWDNVAGQVHVFAPDLGPPPEGSVYRLWLVADDDTWTPVGDLHVGPDGAGSAVIDVPTLARPAARVVVTTEPTGGPNADDKTHGPIGLTGEFLQQ
jgi:anti-sigma-K factor RskA